MKLKSLLTIRLAVGVLLPSAAALVKHEWQFSSGKEEV
jgi:hypothetical protein